MLRGLMLLTASGPIGDYSSFGYGSSPLSQMYENAIRAVARHTLMAVDEPLAKNAETGKPCN